MSIVRQEERCQTNIDILNFAYRWQIKNFSFYCIEMNERLQGQSFYAGTSRWFIDVRRSRYSGDKMTFHLTLAYSGEEEEKVVAKCSLSIEKKDGSKQLIFDSCEAQELYPIEDVKGEIEMSRLTDPSAGLLDEGNLTLLCEIVLPGKIHHKTHNTNYLKHAEQSFLAEDIGSLLESPVCSDAHITVLGRNTTEDFSVHRNILSARSKVFAMMFESDMVERKSGKIIIQDFEPKVVKEMLRFIYTGEAPNLKEMSAELLAVSDKYQIEGLKKLCLEDPTMDNVYNMLVLGDLQRDSDMKRCAVNFIRRNLDSAMASEGWSRFARDQPALLGYVIKTIVGGASGSSSRYDHSRFSPEYSNTRYRGSRSQSPRCRFHHRSRSRSPLRPSSLRHISPRYSSDSPRYSPDDF